MDAEEQKWCFVVMVAPRDVADSEVLLMIPESSILDGGSQIADYSSSSDSFTCRI